MNRTNAGLAAIASFLIPFGASAQDEAPPVVRPAKLIDVVEHDPTLSLALPATIEPSLRATLTMQVGGVLVELPVDEGVSVAEGELIARVDSTELENDYNTAQTELEDAQDEYDRTERLFQSDNVAQVALDRARRELDVARLAADNARKSLEDATLLAPFDGVISSVDVDQFQTVSSSTAIANIQSLENYEVIVNVPAAQIANSANVELIETILILDVAPLIEISATFRFIAPQADPATQTYEVRFEFQPPEGLTVLPGMSGELRAKALLQVPDDLPLVDVPLSAILFDGERTFVWKVDPDKMTVTKQEVSVGATVGEMLPIEEGLSMGDIIVGAGAAYLSEGQQIRRFTN
ncbi:MAG: efflux RND transporter periplasmic adaptor subunit [Pseudomonadota bacterium]